MFDELLAGPGQSLYDLPWMSSQEEGSGTQELLLSPHSKIDDYETDDWFRKQGEIDKEGALLNIVEGIYEVIDARKTQQQEIYNFLQQIHNGGFNRFVLKSVMKEKVNRKKINKQKRKQIAKDKRLIF